MASLTERLLKNSTLMKRSSTLKNSKTMEGRKLVSTSIPMMNVALSGSIDGGLGCGLTVCGGPSRHFKTLFSLVMVSAYMKEHQDAVCLFYDSEFGAGQSYFESAGIDSARVIHTPIMNIEELKFDLIQQLEEISDKDDVIVFVDSIGNLASKKEVDDAKDAKSVADMSRAKSLKSLFRMTTPYLNLKNIPMIVVNHSYSTMEMFSKQVLSGGSGLQYSADTAWIIGRQQEKEGKEVTGYNFIINVEKSRYVKEKSKIPISVSFDEGINKWTGLLDVAVELGHVVKPSNGFYCRAHIVDDKKVRQKNTNTADFWKPVFEDTTFAEDIRKKYQLANNSILGEDDE